MSTAASCARPSAATVVRSTRRGDAFFVAFSRASDALAAAEDAKHCPRPDLNAEALAEHPQT